MHSKTRALLMLSLIVTSMSLSGCRLSNAWTNWNDEQDDNNDATMNKSQIKQAEKQRQQFNNNIYNANIALQQLTLQKAYPKMQPNKIMSTSQYRASVKALQKTIQANSQSLIDVYYKVNPNISKGSVDAEITINTYQGEIAALKHEIGTLQNWVMTSNADLKSSYNNKWQHQIKQLQHQLSVIKNHMKKVQSALQKHPNDLKAPTKSDIEKHRHGTIKSDDDDAFLWYLLLMQSTATNNYNSSSSITNSSSNDDDDDSPTSNNNSSVSNTSPSDDDDEDSNNTTDDDDGDTSSNSNSDEDDGENSTSDDDDDSASTSDDDDESTSSVDDDDTSTSTASDDESYHMQRGLITIPEYHPTHGAFLG